MKKNAYLVLIISCWVLLALALIIKLFGATIFDVVIKNETFIKFGEYADNSWLKYFLACVNALVLHSLVLLSILGQKFYNKIQACIFVPLIIIMSLLSWYNNILSTVLNFACYLLTIIWLKKRWYRSVIGIVLMISFQAISILTKNVGSWNLNNEQSVIAMVLQIDAAIMIVLYYLYSNKLEIKKRAGEK